MDASRASRARAGRVVWGRLPSWRIPIVLLAISTGLFGQSAGSVAGDDQEAAEEGLSLFNLDLLDSRDGYAIPSDTRFVPGQTIHLFFQIKGYEVGIEDRVRLRYKVEALDPAGRRFYRDDGGVVHVELAPQDENWMPIVRYSPRIPDHAGGGIYSIRISVEDELARSAIETAVAITVDGTRLDAADELAVHQFHFSKEENGAGLDEPVFDAGEEIWAAFFISGFETREDNSYDVESNASVIDAEGERMFDFETIGEQGKPYYPRLWLPARMRLDLEDDIPPGSYTVVLRLRDGVGGSDLTQRYSFQIR